MSPRALTIALDGGDCVSGLLHAPGHARACYVLAHGAGAGMTHPFMAAITDALSDRGIATMRYQFPYMEKRSKRPDPPKVAQSAVRAAVAEAAKQLPKLPLFAGGKSFGGRMTSQAQAASALQNVRGLIFLGFPLHPAGRPSDERAEHLFAVQIPTLFMQGTRDALANLSLLEPVVARLGKPATLELFAEADHSFHVRGRKDNDVIPELADAVVRWIDAQR
jgi:uncharacterized protein